MRKIRINKIISLSGVLLFIFLIGCAGLTPQLKPEEEGVFIDKKPGVITEQTSTRYYRFKDVPAPDNFKLDEAKSFVYETPSLKAGILLYTGTGKRADVVNFYKDEMPLYGWKLVNIFEHQGVDMIFDKEGWNCRINISKSFRTNTIEIKIGPKD